MAMRSLRLMQVRDDKSMSAELEMRSMGQQPGHADPTRVLMLPVFPNATDDGFMTTESPTTTTGVSFLQTVARTNFGWWVANFFFFFSQAHPANVVSRVSKTAWTKMNSLRQWRIRSASRE